MIETDITRALLVAMPQLQDPNFRRAVVQLIDHGDQGSFGLVLNREVDLTASDLCESLELDWQGEADVRVRWGGPVQGNTGWVLFGDDVGLDVSSQVAQRVIPGISFAGSLAVLEEVAQRPPDDVCLFLGYAGWGPGQLESEIAAGAWLLAPASADVVFAVEPEAMWSHVVRSLGIDPATLVPTSGVH
ncbi:MAG: YqgE/AlgH family protein [Myxococcota bacterium]|nr:YqgE/AlgH family protein [Myxococcales bacterium]